MTTKTIAEILLKTKKDFEEIVRETKAEIQSDTMRNDTIQNGRVTGDPRYNLRIIPKNHSDLVG